MTSRGEETTTRRVPGLPKIERVLILADGRKADVTKAVGEVDAWLRERVLAVEVEGDLVSFCNEAPAEKLSGDRIPDLVVVLGGDGSILSAVRTFAASPVPVLGINFGRVGFLATVEVPHWRIVLEEVLQGRGVVEPRMRLRAELECKQERFRTVALNDAVVERGSRLGLVTVALHVDGEWVTDYRADGLIVATPSGSTAHSLAAGGPLLAPAMEACIVTPICPHALAHRPIVLHPESVLVLEIKHANGVCTLAVDGQGFYPLEMGDRVTLRRHPAPYPIVVRPNIDPYRRIRDRLGWSGSIVRDGS